MSRSLSAVLLAVLSVSPVASADDAPAKPASDLGSMFAKLDANGDGKLTLEEASQGQGGFFARLIKAGDQDQDGALSQSEFAAAVAALKADVGIKTSGRPEKPAAQPVEKKPVKPAPVEQPVEKKPGEKPVEKKPLEKPEAKPEKKPLEKPEAKPEKKPVKEPADAKTPSDISLFLALDSDKDGKLSKDELQQATGLLAKLDKDGDGAISASELEPPKTKVDKVATPQGEGHALLKKFDKNGDGQLSREEVPEKARDRFDEADADKNGALDAGELAKLRK